MTWCFRKFCSISISSWLQSRFKDSLMSRVSNWKDIQWNSRKPCRVVGISEFFDSNWLDANKAFISTFLKCFPKEGLATQIFEEPFLRARKRADVDKFIAIAGSTHLEKWHSPTHTWKLKGRQWGVQHNPRVTGVWNDVGNKNPLHSHQVVFYWRFKTLQKNSTRFLPKNWLAVSCLFPGRLGSFSFLTLLLAMEPPEMDFVDVNLGQLSVLRTIIALIKISNWVKNPKPKGNTPV